MGTIGSAGATEAPAVVARSAATSAWEGPTLVALFVAALVFGGASQQNPLQTGGLELAGLAAIVLAALGPRERSLQRAAVPLFILAAITLLPLLQLLPLPPSLWNALPRRGDLARDLAAAGAPAIWRPLSVAPDLTLRSALALLAPAAVFLLTLRSTQRTRWMMVFAVIAFAVISVLLASAQMAGGPQSGLRFYPRTNLDSGVGFFSNRNHFAVLLVATIPLVAAAASEAARSRRSAGLQRFVLIAAVAIYVLLVIGVAVSHSRAAVLLLAPAIAGSFLMVFARRDGARQRRLMLTFGAASLAAVALVLAFDLSGIAQRFAQSPETEVRWRTAPVVADVGLSYAPLGAGVGTFDPVYRSVEPTPLLNPEYLNHAHDDYLELFLESGLLGVCVLAVALIWMGAASLRGWRTDGEGTGLERAASLAIAVQLLASLVDYPMRTLAHECLFAFACGVLAAPWALRGLPADGFTRRPAAIRDVTPRPANLPAKAHAAALRTRAVRPF